MNVLITGGSGFIGTNLIESLVSRGYNVLNLDISSPINHEQSDFFQYCDIRDYNSLYEKSLAFSPEVVIHLAARTDLDGKTLDDYNSNTLGVENVCRTVQCLSSVKKTLFASSMLVCHTSYIPKGIDDFSPNTLYGQSKAEGERIIRKSADKLGDFLIFRPTSIWGPWFRVPYRNYFDMVLNRKFFDINGGFCKKTYGYIVNSVNQIESLMVSDIDMRDKLIYIGDSRPIEISYWASVISKEAGIPSPIKLPKFIFKFAALLGDSLKVVGVNFPLTSFRLNNMLTDNVVDCNVATSANRYDEVDLREATISTLKWINQNEK
ncbi:NAD-dependent epimerase/dehydratase family protein [Vibrio furnissii]|uniref:NAD-dependent epimerase/dehydratase family protein n=1 Tax=Vibrio furnissii TaxID=29494 RepID=UPI001F54D555|nr:NAD(P)-dependent oxidoreductase [Vibrio furnissii]